MYLKNCFLSLFQIARKMQRTVLTQAQWPEALRLESLCEIRNWKNCPLHVS